MTTIGGEKLSFGLLQLKAGVTPLAAPGVLTSADLGKTTGWANRLLAVLRGDGDGLLEAAENAFSIAGARASNRLGDTASLADAGDPVRLFAHGRIDAGKVGALGLDAGLTFSNDWGFGLDSGPDSGGRWLNGGDSLTWQLAAGSLGAVSFTVDAGGATATRTLALDIDGDVVRTGTYAAGQNAANLDTLLSLAVTDGSQIAIDFASGSLSINGVARTGTAVDAFFEAAAAGPGDRITIGGSAAAGFSVRDLVLEPTEPGDDAGMIDHPEKIGIGAWQASPDALAAVERLGAAWYYTWDTWALTGSGASEFVPMIWKGSASYVTSASLGRIAAAASDTLLSFNEPERADQSNMSVAEALTWRPQLAATGKRLGSPAVASDAALGDRSWLGQFMHGAEDRGYRVDFVAVHYYAATPDVEAFRSFLTQLHDAYDRPVWVTEWALVDLDTWSSGTPAYDADAVADFFFEATEMMDDLEFVERHAWFATFDGGDGYTLGTHAVEDDGTLTAVGEAFASLTGGPDLV
jgi:hypothetical protein